MREELNKIMSDARNMKSEKYNSNLHETNTIFQISTLTQAFSKYSNCKPLQQAFHH